MEYVALYRKWRPQKFSELVSQKDITRTLINSITNNRLVHAYMFCGSRGTGKTSTARIFAKAINCFNPDNGEPCNECESCKSILSGNSLDIIEIDGASNRGIEEARNLLEKVRFMPVISKYKVYIIDEVHMLTIDAFNVLLKTFEEPPSHVIFILATTEPRKVPLTILSRCQRFDFKRIDENSMEKAVGTIAEKEGYNITEEALSLISRKSNGSMRDALGLLDQSLSYSKDIVDGAVISAILGTVDQAFWDNFLKGLKSRDLKQVFGAIEELIVSGKDLRLFMQDFMKVLSDLLIISLGGDKEDLSKSFLAVLRSHKDDFTSKEILSFINIGSESDQLLRYNPDPRMVIELTIAKMIMALDHEVVPIAPSNTGKYQVDVLSPTVPEVKKPAAVHQPVKARVNPPIGNREIWGSIIKLIKETAPRSMSWVQPVSIQEISGDVIILKCSGNFSMNAERIMSEPHRTNIERCACEVMGKPMKIKIAVDK